MDGYLLINKPKGPTSHDVVGKIRRLYNTKKVGHTGTLDPIATGLMVILIGKATKSADYISADDKSYIAVMKLGAVSDTLDSTGEITYLPEKNITDDELKEAFEAFVGEISQVPPMYSAKKIKGKKLYELARKGETVERKPSIINIYDLKLINRQNSEVSFFVHCSKGTYIRSLIDDIGKKLGYGALMTDLKRVQSGAFSMEKNKAYTFSEIEEEEDKEKLLFPIDYPFSDMKKIIFNSFEEFKVKNGIPFDLAKKENDFVTGEYVRAYNESNEFFAIMEVMSDNILKLKTTFYVQ